jgi:flagellar biosynthesis chaperone FliJ
MGNFTFKLSPVLKKLVRQERACQLAVITLERNRMQLENHIRKCKIQMDDELSGLRNQLIGKANIQMARFQAHATTKLIHRTDELVCKLAGVLAELKMARTNLIDASSRRCAIELLFDRKLREWQKLCLTKEQMELDEMTSTRCFRSDW